MLQGCQGNHICETGNCFACLTELSPIREEMLVNPNPRFKMTEWVTFEIRPMPENCQEEDCNMSRTGIVSAHLIVLSIQTERRMKEIREGRPQQNPGEKVNLWPASQHRKCQHGPIGSPGGSTTQTREVTSLRWPEDGLCLLEPQISHITTNRRRGVSRSPLFCPH